MSGLLGKCPRREHDKRWTGIWRKPCQAALSGKSLQREGFSQTQRGTLECKLYLRVVPHRSQGEGFMYPSCQSTISQDETASYFLFFAPAGKVVPIALEQPSKEEERVLLMWMESMQSWRCSQKVHKGLWVDLSRVPTLPTHQFFFRDFIMLPLLFTCVTDYIYDFSKTKWIWCTN